MHMPTGSADVTLVSDFGTSVNNSGACVSIGLGTPTTSIEELRLGF